MINQVKNILKTAKNQIKTFPMTNFIIFFGCIIIIELPLKFIGYVLFFALTTYIIFYYKIYKTILQNLLVIFFIFISLNIFFPFNNFLFTPESLIHKQKIENYLTQGTVSLLEPSLTGESLIYYPTYYSNTAATFFYIMRIFTLERVIYYSSITMLSILLMYIFKISCIFLNKYISILIIFILIVSGNAKYFITDGNYPTMLALVASLVFFYEVYKAKINHYLTVMLFSIVSIIIIHPISLLFTLLLLLINKNNNNLRIYYTLTLIILAIGFSLFFLQQTICSYQINFGLDTYFLYNLHQEYCEYYKSSSNSLSVDLLTSIKRLLIPIIFPKFIYWEVSNVFYLVALIFAPIYFYFSISTRKKNPFFIPVVISGLLISLSIAYKLFFIKSISIVTLMFWNSPNRLLHLYLILFLWSLFYIITIKLNKASHLKKISNLNN